MVVNRQDDRSGLLSRDDLFLLMESYKNTIELNTTLLEQQKAIVDGNKAITESNARICKEIEEVVKKLDTCAAEIAKTHSHWNASRIKYNSINTEEHLKLKGHLNIITISISTLCVGLIGLVITSISAFHRWGESIELIDSIAKVVGAG